MAKCIFSAIAVKLCSLSNRSFETDEVLWECTINGTGMARISTGQGVRGVL